MWRSFFWEEETESFVNAICKIQDVPDFFSFLSPLFKFFKFLPPNSREREGESLILEFYFSSLVIFVLLFFK